MDYELADKHRELASSFGDFCRNEILPGAARLDEADPGETAGLMRENLAKLGRAGYFRHLLADDMIGRCVAGEELAKNCGATFLSAMSSGTSFGAPVSIFGSDAQRERYLPALALGNLAGCLAYSEEAAGSDLSGIGTRATRRGDGWVLDGGKDLVTNAPLADAFLVLAWTDQTGGLERGLTFFLLDRDTDGLTIGPALSTMGLRGAPTAGINLADCRVFAGAILGGETGRGYGQLMKTLEHIRLAISILSLGLGVASMEESTRHAKARRAFGKPIGLFEGVGAKLAIMFTLNDLCRMMAWKTAWTMEQGNQEATILSSCAKIFASESAREIAHLAMQVQGGHGYLKGRPSERIYRDARFAELAFGASELLRGAIAKDTLDRFKEG
ncbi:MAG: acyl-CoA dehydrogenase family protein [Smithellaceae bacterium]|nr:acyl-CoA dehydrogenase family protein [Smithellaceae bacterium]